MSLALHLSQTQNLHKFLARIATITWYSTIAVIIVIGGLLFGVRRQRLAEKGDQRFPIKLLWRLSIADLSVCLAGWLEETGVISTW